MVSAIPPDLHILAGSLGKLWKVHRRNLPTEVRHAYVELLLTVRRELVPIPGLAPEHNLNRARFDVRRIGDLLHTVAVRGPGDWQRQQNKVAAPTNRTIIRLADHVGDQPDPILTVKNSFLEMVQPAVPARRICSAPSDLSVARIPTLQFSIGDEDDGVNDVSSDTAETIFFPDKFPTLPESDVYSDGEASSPGRECEKMCDASAEVVTVCENPPMASADEAFALVFRECEKICVESAADEKACDVAPERSAGGESSSELPECNKVLDQFSAKQMASKVSTTQGKSTGIISSGPGKGYGKSFDDSGKNLFDPSSLGAMEEEFQCSACTAFLAKESKFCPDCGKATVGSRKLKAELSNPDAPERKVPNTQQRALSSPASAKPDRKYETRADSHAEAPPKKGD